MVTPRDMSLRASVPLDYRPGTERIERPDMERIERPGMERAVMERSDADDRFRAVESRVVLAERTNQGLLEEVARTKNELRAQIRRAEEAVLNEQGARQMLENSLQGSRDVILQLAGRLQRAEEKRQEDRGVISSLATQLRGVEQQSSLAQKDSFTRRELQGARQVKLSFSKDALIAWSITWHSITTAFAFIYSFLCICLSQKVTCAQVSIKYRCINLQHCI